MLAENIKNFREKLGFDKANKEDQCDDRTSDFKELNFTTQFKVQ